jgi:membrane protein implicated in regulation of membrane protease activity
MTDTLWWILLALAVLLLAANAVLPDVWTAWLHERFDPLLHRIRHH